MKIPKEQIIFKKLGTNHPVPYYLLLLADPSKELIDSYLKDSEVYIASLKQQVVGIIVLCKLTNDSIEIKNIGVEPAYQGQGIGTFLIENVIEVCKNNKLKTISIGTANSSIGQLYLYQKLGFEITDIKWNFFIDNYKDPIFENLIQAKHMLLLTKSL
jgi:aminoglycoside 6'-N-acetyltransferase I